MAQLNSPVVPAPAQGARAHAQCASRLVQILLARVRLLSRIAKSTLVTRFLKPIILAMTLYLVLDALLAAAETLCPMSKPELRLLRTQPLS